MTHVIDNPLHGSSLSDNRTNHITTPTGITSPSPFNTKRANKFLKNGMVQITSKTKTKSSF